MSNVMFASRLKRMASTPEELSAIRQLTEFLAVRSPESLTVMVDILRRVTAKRAEDNGTLLDELEPTTGTEMEALLDLISVNGNGKAAMTGRHQVKAPNEAQLAKTLLEEAEKTINSVAHGMESGDTIRPAKVIAPPSEDDTYAGLLRRYLYKKPAGTSFSQKQAEAVIEPFLKGKMSIKEAAYNATLQLRKDGILVHHVLLGKKQRGQFVKTAKCGDGYTADGKIKVYLNGGSPNSRAVHRKKKKAKVTAKVTTKKEKTLFD